MKKFIVYSILFIGLMIPGKGVFADELNDTTADFVETTEGLDGDSADDAEVIDGMYEDSTESDMTEDSESDDIFVNYDGDIDIFTGLPKEVSDSAAATGMVNVSGKTQYDTDSNLYIYPLEGDAKLGITVADGMVVNETVSMYISGDADVTLYKDGNKVLEMPEYVSDPGSYIIESGSAESSEQVMSFMIVGEVSNYLTNYVLPDGFNVVSVFKDSQQVKTGAGSVDMSDEAYYEISYECVATHNVYTLRVMTDFTAPEVEFEGLDDENDARGPVTLKGLQSGDSVYATRNGEDTTLNSDYQFTQSGTYQVIVSDMAGNTVTKEFRILVYLNLNAALVVSIILAIIIGIIVALYITRKRLRVR